MKLDISSAQTKLQPYINGVRQHRIIIFILFFLGMYGFLVYQVGSLTEGEPDHAAITEKLETIKRLQVDQKSIDSLLKLEEQNIEVKSLFKQARDNPFTE